MDMRDWMIYVPIIFVCAPIILTILFYQIHFRIKQHQWKAVHFAVQLSVIFYIIADIILLNWIFSRNFLGIILISLIVVLSVILILQRKNKAEVILKDGITVLLRLAFLLFLIAYVGLLLYVVISGYLA